MIESDFDIDLGKIQCVVCPNKFELGKIVGTKYESPPMGVYRNGVIHVLSPTQWISGKSDSETEAVFTHDGPIAHELVHLAVDKATEGNYPIWFTEGIALYFENKYTGYEWQPDVNADDISYQKLNTDFYSISDAKAYRKSFEIIDAFVYVNGEDALMNILEKLSTGKRFAVCFYWNEHWR
jgi:hypothetical protein